MGYFNNEGFRNDSIKNMGHFLFAASVFFEHKFTIALSYFKSKSRLVSWNQKEKMWTLSTRL